MRLSARIEGVTQGGSDGWDVHYRARALQAEGRAVTMLTVGDHDVKVDGSVIDAMAASAHGGNTGYSPTIGQPALRALLAERLTAATGAPVTAQEVLVTAGGQAALFFSMMAVLDPGDTCLLIDPFYATFPLTVRAASARVAAVPAAADAGFVPDPAAIDAVAAATGAKALLINSPNNPTGAVYDRATLEGIAEVCRARDLWLISDELYDSQVFDGEPVSPRGLPGMAERTIVLGSMSKSHAMTGFRLGWLCGPAPLVKRAGEFAIAATYGTPGFIQDAAMHALTAQDGIEARIAARYRRRRDAALAVLEGAPGLRVVRPKGGMYLMVDIRPTGLSGHDFAMGLLEAEGVAVMPGESFGPAAAGHLRVALTVPDDALVAALRRLAAHAGRLAAARAA
jgi:arginine:pyruvate transaminase